MKDTAGRAMKVSVVILNWRASEMTGRCIRSLDTELGPGVEVVVVDNASGDASPTELRLQHPSVAVVEAEANLGFAGGCNRGIRFAESRGAEFVWLLNNDAEVQPGALSALLEAISAGPRLGAVGSVQRDPSDFRRVCVWGGGRVNLRTGIPSACRSPGDSRAMQYLSGASILLRMCALQEIGLLDDAYFLYWEDTDLSFRLREAGWGLAIAEESIVYHRGFGSLDPGQPAYDYHFTRSSIRFLRKHAPFPALPIAVSVGGRLVKRACAGRWASVAGVWRAARGMGPGHA